VSFAERANLIKYLIGHGFDMTAAAPHTSGGVQYDPPTFGLGFSNFHHHRIVGPALGVVVIVSKAQRVVNIHAQGAVSPCTSRTSSLGQLVVC
jgi:hypothetical protein